MTLPATLAAPLDAPSHQDNAWNCLPALETQMQTTQASPALYMTELAGLHQIIDTISHSLQMLLEHLPSTPVTTPAPPAPLEMDSTLCFNLSVPHIKIPCLAFPGAYDGNWAVAYSHLPCHSVSPITGPAQQVMGPKNNYDISNTKLTVLKLAASGSNWTSYQEHIINTITSKKLQQHVIGTMHEPVALVKCDGSFFWDDKSLFLLLDKQIEKHENIMEDWVQKEATICEIIYATVDQSTFHQIKGKPTAAAVWKKLTSIHGDKGSMFETDLLAQLQNSCFIENSEVSMHDHLAGLAVLKEHLAEISCPITSATCRPPCPLLCSTNRSLQQSSPMPMLLKSLYPERTSSGISMRANNAAIESSINQHYEAMVAAHSKAKSKSKDAKGKAKSKEKGTDKHYCDNCRKDGHTSGQCFEEGGGMAGKAPNLWVKKHKSKEKDKVKSANAIKTNEKSDKNYAFLTFIPLNAPNNPTNENITLAITSGHSHKAHAASLSASIIIDCGASSHFLG
ncbi:hypothetical protein C0995_016364 [Termitomyces sp. Mi166|nr:hypothetical protein C0995_016364 [Termitomyces sp. Mi166\